VRLNITSSAVSQRVRALEIRLGVPLIVRTRPCRATQMGQRLLQYLRRASLLEHDVENDLAGANEAMLNVAVAVNADTLSTRRTR
jgi:LysR family transcriptional regulator, chromosome initiation inhibitor